MGKIIRRVRDRELQRQRRMFAQAEFDRLLRLLDAHPFSVFARIVDWLKGRLRQKG
jgi:hypothetical protein